MVAFAADCGVARVLVCIHVFVVVQKGGYLKNWSQTQIESILIVIVSLH